MSRSEFFSTSEREAANSGRSCRSNGLPCNECQTAEVDASKGKSETWSVCLDHSCFPPSTGDHAAFFSFGAAGTVTVIQTVSAMHFGQRGNIAFFCSPVSARQQPDA